jgi:hypothetical protein
MTTNKTLTKSLIEKLIKNKDTLVLPNNDTISRSIAEKILIDIQEKYDLDSAEDSLVVIAIFAQKGATSSKCSGNMTYTHDSIDYKLGNIRTIFAKHKSKNGIRKFAKTYGSKIYEICKILDIPGNMYHKVVRFNPNSNISKQDKYWVSDFQAYNDDAPIEIRNLIIKTFPKNQKQNIKNKT